MPKEDEEKPKNDRGPNDLITDDDLLGNRNAQKEKRKEVGRSLGYALDDKKMRAERQRKRMYEVVLREIFKNPLDTVETKWENTRAGFAAQKDQGQKVTVEMLNKSTLGYAAEMDKLLEAAKAYLNQITKFSQDQKLTPEVLIKALDGINSQASKVAEILILDQEKYGDLIKALQYALNMSQKENGSERAADAKDIEKAAFAALEKYLKNSEMSGLAWTIIGLISPEDKKTLFLTTFLKKIPAGEGMELLVAGNKIGVLSSVEMEEILKKSGKLAEVKGDFQQNKGKYQQNWNERNVVFEKAKKLMKKFPPQAGDMITLKNTFIFILKTAAVATITANTAISLFYKANFKQPASALKSALTNPYSILAVGGLALEKILTAEETPGEYITQDKATAKEQAKANIRDTIHNIPQILTYFDLAGKEGANSIYKFGQYVKEFSQDDSDPLPEEFLKVAKFKEWLGQKAQKDAKYKRLKGSFPVMSDERFAELTRSFYALKIGETSAKNYREMIKEKPFQKSA